MYRYQLSGLAVASEIAFPGAIPAMTSDAPDLVVVVGAVPEQLYEGADPAQPVQLDGRHVLVKQRGVGRFMASDGDMLRVMAEEGAQLSELMPSLLGTGLAAILLQRGKMILHASSVIAEGRAFSFCGPSGMGKSTLAAALCDVGCELLGDDIAVVDIDQSGRPVLWPDGRQLRLFEDSIDKLSLKNRRRQPVEARLGKYFVDGRSAIVAGPVPIGAIFLLEREGDLRDEHPAIERLSSFSAASALLAQSFRPEMARRIGDNAKNLGVFARVLSGIPVFRFARPFDLDNIYGNAETIYERIRSLLGDHGEKGEGIV